MSETSKEEVPSNAVTYEEVVVVVVAGVLKPLSSDSTFVGI